MHILSIGRPWLATSCLWSVPISSIGRATELGSVPLASGLGCVGQSAWHNEYAAMVCSMSFFICGQGIADVLSRMFCLCLSVRGVVLQ